MSKEQIEDQEQNNAVDSELKEDNLVNEQESETTETNEATEEEEESAESEGNELSRIQDELTESKDKYLRLYSEFENFRRRTAKEKLSLIQTANEDLMTALLSVLDDFERAQKSFEAEGTDLKAVKEGLDLVQNKFKKTLEQKGLEVMKSKEGSDFDPDFHEAITQIPAPKKKLKGKVVDVIEKGYLLKDKVIRYAKVVIGS